MCGGAQVGGAVGSLPLTVVAGVGHGRVVLEVSVLVLRHGGGEAAVSAPVGVGICRGKKKKGKSAEKLKQAVTEGWWEGGGTHWRARR